MHGQQTLKHLNEQAVAQAILAKHNKDQIDPVFQKAVEEALAVKAQATYSAIWANTGAIIPQSGLTMVMRPVCFFPRGKEHLLLSYKNIYRM